MKRQRGRPLAEDQPRTEVIKTRLTVDDAARLDAARGTYTRADWLRGLIKEALK